MWDDHQDACILLYSGLHIVIYSIMLLECFLWFYYSTKALSSCPKKCCRFFSFDEFVTSCPTTPLLRTEIALKLCIAKHEKYS